jgi:hypothetical protein
MTISTANVGQTASTVTYASTDDNAVTFMSLCNFSAGTVTVDVHVVPTGDIAGTGNLVIKGLNIASEDTYILYKGNEKIVLSDLDFIEVLPSGTVTDPILATAMVADIEYRIITLGTTDFTVVGATEVLTGSFVPGTEYIITNVGGTDFTLIGALANTVGVIFTATGVGGGTGGTAIETVFTASGAGTGTGTVKTSVLTVITSYMGV